MKVTVDAESKQILGAAILGPGGDEAIHSILDFMYTRSPYTVLQRSVNIHPTVFRVDSHAAGGIETTRVGRKANDVRLFRIRPYQLKKRA